MTGDFHTHTWLSDGVCPESLVVQRAFQKFGLHWMANSEHGGAFNHNPFGGFWDTMTTFDKPYFKGKDAGMSGGHRNLWRWQSLAEYSYPIVSNLRDQYPSFARKIIQGVEWNCPSHEHASVGFLTDEPISVSNFEYLFDQNDRDTSRNAEFGIISPAIKKNVTHQDAVTAAAWLQNNYKNSSYFLLNHPSRKLLYSIAHIRDFCNAAPDVFIGLEGMPGHQKESSRGGYTSTNPKAQTYGGTDYMCAKVGGIWDALLSEGRRCFMYSNSDFHDSLNDFFPGEYQKNYSYVIDENRNGYIGNEEFLKGIRSGNTWVVQGDLVKALKFLVIHGKDTATMGQTISVPEGEQVTIVLAVQSGINNAGNRVSPHHADLISGPIRSVVLPGTPEYNVDSVAGVSVIKTFTSKDAATENKWAVIRYNVTIDHDSYFRIRGTNMPKSTPNETDANGNPLSDFLMGTNNAYKAYADLWFYTNPIWVKKVDRQPVTGCWNITQVGSATQIFLTGLSQDVQGNINGNALLNGSITGTVSGTIVGSSIAIDISWSNNVTGHYTGTLTTDGSQIIDGVASAPGYTTEQWSAVRVPCTPIPVTGCWEITQVGSATQVILSNLSQDEYGNVIGNALLNGTVTGSVSGNVLGSSVTLDITWSNSSVTGRYTGTLTADGSRIINGVASAPGYTPEQFSALRITCQ